MRALVVQTMLGLCLGLAFGGLALGAAAIYDPAAWFLLASCAAGFAALALDAWLCR